MVDNPRPGDSLHKEGEDDSHILHANELLGLLQVREGGALTLQGPRKHLLQLRDLQNQHRDFLLFLLLSSLLSFFLSLLYQGGESREQRVWLPLTSNVRAPLSM